MLTKDELSSAKFEEFRPTAMGAQKWLSYGSGLP
jgi:hypothetical protein